MQCFFDFFMTAPSKTPSFEGGTPQGTPEMVPKPMEARGTSSKKSKKRQAIAVAALGPQNLSNGCGRP